MCRFHHNVAFSVSHDTDDIFDSNDFLINAIAIGTNFCIGDYLPDLPNSSGYNQNELASKTGRKNFEDFSSKFDITYDPEAFALYRQQNLPYLRQRTAEINAKHSFNNKTVKVFRNKWKAADFTNYAPDELFLPFKNLSADIFKNKKDSALLQPLRLAGADYWNDKKTQEIITELFKQSVVMTCVEAQEKAHPSKVKLYEKVQPIIKPLKEKLPQWVTSHKTGSATAGVISASLLYAGVHAIHFAAMPAVSSVFSNLVAKAGSSIMTAYKMGDSLSNIFAYSTAALVTVATIGAIEVLDTVSDHPMDQDKDKDPTGKWWKNMPWARTMQHGIAIAAGFVPFAFHSLHQNKGDIESKTRMIQDNKGQQWQIKESGVCGKDSSTVSLYQVYYPK
jgi:hypothetical protein